MLPRDVLQTNALSQKLGLGSQLNEWYQDAISVPYGHLFFDLSRKQLIHFVIAFVVAKF